MEDLYIENSITRGLDNLLKEARSGKYKMAPVGMVCKLTGFGKTASTKAWLNHNKVNHLYIDAPSRNINEMEVEVFDSIPNSTDISLVSKEQLEKIFTPKKKILNVMFTSDEIDSIDKDTAIIIDNYCFASKQQRDELLKYINKCLLADPRSESGYSFRNPLFIFVIFDQNTLIINNPLTKEEINLFGLEEYL